MTSPRSSSRLSSPTPPPPRGDAAGPPQVHLRRRIPGGRKVKCMAEEKARGGGRALRWADGFDLKWKTESKPCVADKAKTKWGAKEASEDDNKKPSWKCVQIDKIPAGCDVQIEWGCSGGPVSLHGLACCTQGQRNQRCSKTVLGFAEKTEMQQDSFGICRENRDAARQGVDYARARSTCLECCLWRGPGGGAARQPRWG